MQQRIFQSRLAFATTMLVLLVQTATAQFDVGPSVEYGPAVDPSGMTSGDFDGDNDVDLATTADGPDRIVVLRNAGDGTFSLVLGALLPSGSSPSDLIAGDLDGDLDIDLAVALRDPAGTVRLMLNNGTGSFTMGADLAVGDRPGGMSIGDLDGDLDLDIVVANRDSDTLSILINDGTGGFSVSSVATGGEPRDTAMGNFVGNADLEIAVTNHDDRTVWVYAKNAGVYAPVMTLAVGALVRPDGITAGNLDGLGLDDLATATSNFGGGGGVAEFAAVFLNTGAGFAGPFNYDTQGMNSSEIITADLDCDGSLDLVVANKDSDDLSLMHNQGDGTFAAGQLVQAGAEPSETTAADLDGDGAADVAVTNSLSNDVSVLMNHTCGVPGDVDGDGDVDLTDLAIMLADFGCGTPPCAGDADGDGDTDLSDLALLLANFGT